jgi:hypothetical protein
MTPEQLIELAKSYGPIGALAAVIAASWRQRTADKPQEHDTALDKLRADMMAEFKDLGGKLGDLRDRVSRIDGSIGKDGK